MRGKWLASVACLALAVGSVARADTLPAEEQAFLDKHMPEVVMVTPKKLADAAVTKSFSAPIYELTITINMGDGATSGQTQIVAKVDDKLVPVSRPGTDGDYPMIARMFNPAFKLKTDDDAKQLQSALDAVFPTIGDEDKKAVAFSHKGNEWTFIRGKFIQKHQGFVLVTDDSGKVTGVKYSLQVP